MSTENVKSFYETITRDEGLRQKLAELSQKKQGEAADEEARIRMVNEDILPLAEEMGMPFTLEELKQYENGMNQANGDNELNDAELQAVAAGRCDQCVLRG